MDTQYIVLSGMIMFVLACSTLTFGYCGLAYYQPRRYLTSAFSWICCGVYFGMTALSGFVFWG